MLEAICLPSFGGLGLVLAVFTECVPEEGARSFVLWAPMAQNHRWSAHPDCHQTHKKRTLHGGWESAEPLRTPWITGRRRRDHVQFPINSMPFYRSSRSVQHVQYTFTYRPHRTASLRHVRFALGVPSRSRMVRRRRLTIRSIFPLCRPTQMALRRGLRSVAA